PASALAGCARAAPLASEMGACGSRRDRRDRRWGGRVLDHPPVHATRAVAASSERRGGAQALAPVPPRLKRYSAWPPLGIRRGRYRLGNEKCVEPRGFEPLTSALQRQRSTN